jgi:hypothetical protein
MQSGRHAHASRLLELVDREKAYSFATFTGRTGLRMKAGMLSAKPTPEPPP